MSRFLYFFLGAGIGAWWTTHKKDCQFQRTVLAPPPSPNPSQQVTGSESRPDSMLNQTTYNREVWDQERARVQQFSKSAGDTIAELSEVTLNTILQATEALKAKMAEQRALREAERRLEEERRRTPPRYV
ncbi:hypothetical protein C8R44DRAFT_890049 [Mycena epipterygia]|nr:hypothetical protein C8R44DRAFT_890049 [Mycena epipterygia]